MYRPLGEGDVDLAGIVRLLTESGYDGWYVMEQDLVIDPSRGEARHLLGREKSRGRQLRGELLVRHFLRRERGEATRVGDAPTQQRLREAVRAQVRRRVDDAAFERVDDAARRLARQAQRARVSGVGNLRNQFGERVIAQQALHGGSRGADGSAPRES